MEISRHLGWVRLGNTEFTFLAGFLILESNEKSENGFKLREIRPRDG